MIWRPITEFCIIIAYFAIICFGFLNNSLVILLTPFFFLAGVFLTRNPPLFLSAVIALAFSRLRIPTLPQKAELFYLLVLSFGCFILVTQFIKQRSNLIYSRESKWALAFGLVLLIVMLGRGVGSQSTGSGLWGGGAYFEIFTALLFLFFCNKTNINSKTLRRAIFAMYALGSLPTLAHAVLLSTNGQISWQYLFLRQPFMQIQELGMFGQWRLEKGAEKLFLALPFIYYQRPFSWRNIPLTSVCVAISLIIASLTGHRLEIINILIILLGMVIVSNRAERTRGTLFILTIVALILAAGIMADQLPFPVQRAISTLSKTNISEEAMISAEGTTLWRVDMWKNALSEIPDYLILGKGLAFDQRRLSEIIYLGLYTRDWGIITSSYHNGPLSLIITTGLPGLLTGTAFLISCLLGFGRRMMQDWKDPLAYQLFKWLFVCLTGQILIFYTTYGDIQTSFPYFFIYAGLLTIVIRNYDQSVSMDRE